jgi:hypothetical protein
VFAAGIGLLVVGIVLGILIPPFGFVVAVAGLLVLLGAFVAGRRGAGTGDRL